MWPGLSSPSKVSDDGSCSGIFTLDEVNRLKIIQDVVDRRLTTPMAAQRLGISDRQCRRLLLRYHESGPPGMA
ncbi:helix-turn-helix domain-containing protein, partial [Klebsiella pneumoniae]|uniref:helix-turn-helix domain-containing protein n=1 Tax=Klebsiella pneumoniae TaxID=573 RepID=UPI003EE0B694